MEEHPQQPTVPDRPDDSQDTRIGVDTWVAEADERRAERRGLFGLFNRGWDATPDSAKLLGFIVIAVSFPFWPSIASNEGRLFSYGFYTLLFAMLGLGLNVVVGFAGLLDLGYVAFYGFGGYAYALLASSHYDLHVPSELALPMVMAGTAFVGLLLGLSSRRLLGDYLAIVTLFFLQAFYAFTQVANPRVAGKGLTGGPNGIPDVDTLNFFGYKLNSTRQYYFFMLIVFAAGAAGIYLINKSRTGRAWRALREDPLAAEVMSIPVNRLKILAFVFGAAIAGLCGAIFTANETAAAAGNFTVSVLITIYVIVILGGLGSIAGVLIGAAVVNITFQFLTPSSPDVWLTSWLFYLTILVAVGLMKPWYRAVIVLVGTTALGFLAHGLVHNFADPSWTAGHSASSGWLGSHITSWVIIPQGHSNINTWLYCGLVVAIVALSQLKGWWRTIMLMPVLYMTAMVWEILLVKNPAVTALILFGVMLIALMIRRPQGLLGTARVEIV
jgi:branched-chain amino acid transport system permease protein